MNRPKHDNDDDFKNEIRKRKEILKALETPEQKRQRRLKKKEEKERRRKRLMGWDEEYMGYTNEDNPFGDSNLHETFVWKKKYEKMGVKDIDEEEIDEDNKKKMLKNRQELEKVKKRRLEREREREMRMEELSKMQRDKEAEQFKEWSKQEDYFHLRQAKLRSKLRIKEGRAKPIDLLARYINVFGENLDDTESLKIEENSEPKQNKKGEDEEDLLQKIQYLSGYLPEPYNTLNGLRIRDMEDLIEDVKVYMELDSRTKINAEYWKDLQIIVEDELTKLKQANMDTMERRREGINSSVSADIARILRSKTPQQLKVLRQQIEKKIASREDGIDIGYWETLLSRLKAQISRARLREFHDENLKKRKELIAQHQQDIYKLQIVVDQKEIENIATDQKDSDVEEMKYLTKAERRQKCIQDYEKGSYSPETFSIDEVDSDAILMSVEDFEKDLKEQRLETLKRLKAFPVPFIATNDKSSKTQSLNNYDHNTNPLTQAEESFIRVSKANMGDDEAIFSVEEELIDDKEMARRKTGSNLNANEILLKDKYNWAEKYRPRKPRYFNRVHTGFEWNKYNQTHYDVDNPPPKVVQGYKFNIFYPDLIDKSSSPTYKITPCSDNNDFAFIRFSAGPPYEDICFKIVNREWNYSYKSGFRCQFQNNILQLWFHFKRYRYRR
ncbi:hypothetical protein NH340_JMT05527 [Sarcoptes scabiei]|nr:hypothetical protein NH340_JMT05527 [Sarcoptes scabiei]